MATTDLLAPLRSKAGLEGESATSGTQGDVRHKDHDFKELYIEEAVARSSLTKVSDRLQSLHKMLRELRKVMLPGSAQQLTAKILAEEQATMKLIKRTHELIVILQGSEEGAVVEDFDDELDDLDHFTATPSMSPAVFKQRTLQKMRRNLSTVLTLDLSKVSEEFVDFKQQRRLEGVERTRRHLKFAFPDALENDIEQAMEMPEIAAEAVKRRLDDKEKCPKLHVLIDELQSSKLGMQKRLEAEARDIEILFMRFSEMVGSNDQRLTEVESNISSTLVQTTEALQNLADAQDLQKGNNRRRVLMQCCCFGVLIFMVYSFVAPIIDKTRWLWAGSENYGEWAMAPTSNPQPAPVTLGNAEQADAAARDQGAAGGSLLALGARQAEKSMRRGAMDDILEVDEVE